MTHAEYIIDDKEDIYLVEAANRGGGCFTSEIIVPNHSGVDLVTKLLNDSILDVNVNERVFEKKEVLLKFLNFNPGVVKKITGFDILNTSPNVLSYRIPIAKGDEILKTTSDANRHGFVIVQSKLNVRTVSKNLINQINIEYEI